MTIVAEVAGVPEGSQAALACTQSTMGQCLAYGNMRKLGKYFGHAEFQYTPEFIDSVARHITQFSLAGIRAVAQQSRQS